VEEIRAILSDQFHYLTLKDYPTAPAVKEDADTFPGNATLKAVKLAEWIAKTQLEKLSVPGSKFFVLADDSGLEVDALNGAPGVHSARFAALDSKHEGNSSDAENNAKLLRLLKDIPTEKRSARFRCVIALTPVFQLSAAGSSPVCDANEFELQTEIFDGACEGRIATKPGGQGGFGYDPLFVPNGYQQSFAELGEVTKNQLSHRAKALAKLRQRLDSMSAV
jgi:XTP/dITP diphosphohydrolase